MSYTDEKKHVGHGAHSDKRARINRAFKTQPNHTQGIIGCSGGVDGSVTSIISIPLYLSRIAVIDNETKIVLVITVYMRAHVELMQRLNKMSLTSTVSAIISH